METTINISHDRMRKITGAAQSAGVSRSALITTLIKTAMDEITDPGRPGSMVRYQKKRSVNEWHVFHLQVRMDDYEYFLDLRKLLKMSVSLILAYAVDKYLGKQKLIKTDNYWCKNYVIIKETINDIICWKFIWGFPPDLHTILPDG